MVLLCFTRPCEHGWEKTGWNNVEARQAGSPFDTFEKFYKALLECRRRKRAKSPLQDGRSKIDFRIRDHLDEDSINREELTCIHSRTMDRAEARQYTTTLWCQLRTTLLLRNESLLRCEKTRLVMTDGCPEDHQQFMPISCPEEDRDVTA